MFFVRSATQGDLKAVSALLEDVAAVPVESRSPAALKSNLERPASEFVVADDGRRIGGMAYARVTEKDVVTLLQLYVLPELHGQGIGRDLFAEIETCFDGAKVLRVEVEPANGAVVAFFERHGMAPAGSGTNSAGIEMLVMEKPLN